jgi:hypothetical protein
MTLVLAILMPIWTHFKKTRTRFAVGSNSGSVHQLETPESSVHCMLMPWTNNYNSPVTPDSDSLASSVVKGSGGEEGVWKATYSDVVHFVL